MRKKKTDAVPDGVSDSGPGGALGWVQGVPAEEGDRPVYVPATVDRENAQALLGGVLPPQSFGPPNRVEEPDGVRKERDRLAYLRSGARSRFNIYNHLAGQALVRVEKADGEGYRRRAQRELTSILREQRAETEMLVKLGSQIIEYGLMLGEDVTGVPKEAKDGGKAGLEKREGRVLPMDPVSARAAARLRGTSGKDAAAMSDRVAKESADGVEDLDEEEAEAAEDAEDAEELDS